MRKECKRAHESAEHTRQQGYHEERNYTSEESYAFQGWSALKYFTSDRAEKLLEDFKRENGKALKGYGLEIEVECNSIGSANVLAEVIDKLIFSQYFPKDLFKQQHDGSLTGAYQARNVSLK